MPTVATHYPVAAALRQKVLALIGRREVQVRDLFDLSIFSPGPAGMFPAWQSYPAKSKRRSNARRI